MRLNTINCFHKTIFFIFISYILLLSGSIALAQVQRAEPNSISGMPAASKAVTPGRIYKLSGKIKIKESLKPCYWKEQKQVNWEKEVKSWHFGFFPGENILPPMVIFKDNFIAESIANFHWINNGATLLVINPLNKEAVTRLTFFVNAFKKDITLQVCLNGKIKEKIFIPYKKEAVKFTKFSIDDVVLSPGENEITFYEAGKDQSKHRKEKNLFVRLRDDIIFEVKALNPASQSILGSDIFYDIESNNLNVFTSFENENNNALCLMGRDLDINLDEFPFFDIDCKLEKRYSDNLNIFVGIDFNNDSKVDGYLNLPNLYSGNLLNLARSKWANDSSHYYPSFNVRHIFILYSWFNKNKITEDSDFFKRNFYSFKLLNFRFYIDRSIIIPVDSLTLESFEIGRTTSIARKKVVSDRSKGKRAMLITSYLQRSQSKVMQGYRGEEDGNFSVSSYAGKKPKEEYLIELVLPVNIRNLGKTRNTYLAFSYGLQDPNVQKLNVFLGLDRNGDGRIDEKKFMPEDDSIDLFGEGDIQRREIKLPSGTDAVKQIIFQVSKKNSIEEDGWYGLFIQDDIEIYRQYPSMIKNEELRKNFLAELSELNLPLFKIGLQGYKFSQINNLSWDVFESGVINLGSIRLPAGRHAINLADNNAFKVERVYLEAMAKEEANNAQPSLAEPTLTFKKINLTKYIIQVKGARDPFWLVLAESFNPQWKIFLADKSDRQGFDIIKDYQNLGVKEAKYQLNCSPWDLKYLFAKPLSAEHFFANFYANAWYINPKKMNMPEEFCLVLCFWPQYLYNIGVIIAGVTLILSIACLLVLKKRRFKHD